MKEIKLVIGALLAMLLLPLLIYFGIGMVMLAFGDGDAPGWAVIFLVMFFLPLLLVFDWVRRTFGLTDLFGSGTARRGRRTDDKLTLPDGTVVDYPDLD